MENIGLITLCASLATLAVVCLLLVLECYKANLRLKTLENRIDILFQWRKAAEKSLGFRLRNFEGSDTGYCDIEDLDGNKVAQYPSGILKDQMKALRREHDLYELREVCRRSGEI